MRELFDLSDDDRDSIVLAPLTSKTLDAYYALDHIAAKQDKVPVVAPDAIRPTAGRRQSYGPGARADYGVNLLFDDIDGDEEASDNDEANDSDEEDDDEETGGKKRASKKKKGGEDICIAKQVASPFLLENLYHLYLFDEEPVNGPTHYLLNAPQDGKSIEYVNEIIKIADQRFKHDSRTAAFMVLLYFTSRIELSCCLKVCESLHGKPINQHASITAKQIKCSPQIASTGCSMVGIVGFLVRASADEVRLSVASYSSLTLPSREWNMFPRCSMARETKPG